MIIHGIFGTDPAHGRVTFAYRPATGTWKRLARGPAWKALESSGPAAAASGAGWRTVATVGAAHHNELPGFFYHFGGGRWTRRTIPAPAGARAVLSSLTWIPGTRSLWASATAIAAGKQTGEILKFGP